MVRQNTRWQSAEEVERHQRGLDEAILEELSGAHVIRFPGSSTTQRSQARPPEKAGIQPLVIPRPEGVRS